MQKNKLKPKERAEMYLFFYKLLESNNWKDVRTNYIYKKTDLPSGYDILEWEEDGEYMLSEVFPEFALFRNPKSNTLRWWSKTDLNSRKNALLLAAEITKDAKE